MIRFTRLPRVAIPWMASLLLLPLLVTACSGRPKPPDYEAAVNDKLRTSAIEGAIARWKADEQTLHLTGAVKSHADSVRAEELAVAVVGSGRRVVNDLKVVEPPDEDALLQAELEQLAKEDLRWTRNTSNLAFIVKEGVVTISGEVATRGVRYRIVQRVRGTKGVTNVVDRLRIVATKPARKTATQRSPRRQSRGTLPTQPPSRTSLTPALYSR
jgi:hypothetical protein